MCDYMICLQVSSDMKGKSKNDVLGCGRWLALWRQRQRQGREDWRCTVYARPLDECRLTSIRCEGFRLVAPFTNTTGRDSGSYWQRLRWRYGFPNASKLDLSIVIAVGLRLENLGLVSWCQVAGQRNWKLCPSKSGAQGVEGGWNRWNLNLPTAIQRFIIFLRPKFFEVVNLIDFNECDVADDTEDMFVSTCCNTCHV